MTLVRPYLAKRFKFVSRPAAEPEWKSLHRVADRNVPAFSRAFLNAVADLKSNLTLEMLEERLSRREPGLVLQAIPFDAMRLALERDYMRLYGDVAASAAKVSAPFLGKQSGVIVRVQKEAEPVEFVFDARNPAAVSQAARFAADLVREIDQETREAIREIIVRAQQEGISVRDQARLIRDHIGLTRRQQNALFSLERALGARGLSPEKLDQQIARAYNRALRHRAQTIARTETIKAANAGQQELWQQAADRGLIDRQRTRRKWIATPDQRICPICEALDGQTAGLDEAFVSRDVGLIAQPPAHVACRCSIALTFRD